MSATLAPASWPVSHASRGGGPWVFGREVTLAGDADAPRALQWLLRRNCSITPGQLGAVYGSLCVVSLLIGGFFLVQGAPLVLAFAGLELLLDRLYVAISRFAADPTDFYHLPRDRVVELGERVAI